MHHPLRVAASAGIVLATLGVVAAAQAVAEPLGAHDGVRTKDEKSDPPHAVRPTAAPSTSISNQTWSGIVDQLGRAVAYTQGVQRAQWFEAIARNQAAEAARQAAARRASSSRVVTSNGGPGGVLACIRHRESRGNYGVVNPRSGTAGAYQFMPGTWNNTARSAGRADLVGVNPANASPADQDAMAQHLLATQGLAPWGGGCR
jgi:hypothetical protein